MRPPENIMTNIKTAKMTANMTAKMTAKMTDDMKISATFVVFSLMVLVINYFNDRNHDIERFYIQTDKPKYLLLKYSKYILYVALIYNVKHLLFTYLKVS